MDLIKTLLPIFGVVIGWLLSESGKIITDKRQDSKKLKKLLYFLLELRHYLTIEFSREESFIKYIELLLLILNNDKQKYNISEEINLKNHDFNSIYEQIFNSIDNNKDKLIFLEENIDKTVLELSEFLPIIAYELSGSYNIKDKLQKIDTITTKVKSLTNIRELSILKELLTTVVSDDLLNQIDDSILTISKKIGVSAFKESKEKIIMLKQKNTEVEMRNSIEDTIEMVTSIFKNTVL